MSSFSRTDPLLMLIRSVFAPMPYDPHNALNRNACHSNRICAGLQIRRRICRILAKRVDLKVENYSNAIKLAPQNPSRPRSTGGLVSGAPESTSIRRSAR